MVHYWTRTESIMPRVGMPDLDEPLYRVRTPVVRPLMAMDHISAQSAFIRSRKAENSYARQLRQLAEHIGRLIDGVWSPDAPEETSSIVSDLLNRYAATITPWAAAVGQRMVTEVAARDRQAWRKTAAKMGSLLQRDLDQAPIGHVVRERLASQVELITSLPRDAAERVHKLTLEGIVNGTRAAEISKEIMRSGHVTKARATLIARTEVGRTSTALTQARAESIGSTQYIWRSAGDSDVRPSHREMNGRVCEWADKPITDGMAGHPGETPNCRCYAEPIVPDLYT